MHFTTEPSAARHLAAMVLAAAMAVSGCTSTPTVRSDYDKSADFGKYHTFGFVDQGQGDVDGTKAKSLAMQALEAAATREMEARGYKLADSPDVLVVFSGKLEDRTDVQSVPGPSYGVGWGYGGWYGAPYGGYNTQVTTRHYKVGTLVMDIVDREKRLVVFQAGMERTVTKEMLDKKEQALNTAVTRLFSTYPFVAGQSAPVALPDKK
jgi:hypothetical protein